MSKNATLPKKGRAKLITQNEFVLLPHHIEHPEGESMTVPDESMSIREIMRKHVSGMRIKESLFRQGFYEDTDDFDSPDFSEISRLDLSEKDELREFNAKKVEDLTKKQQASLEAKKNADKKASQKPEEAKDDARTKDEARTKSDAGEKDAK